MNRAMAPLLTAAGVLAIVGGATLTANAVSDTRADSGYASPERSTGETLPADSIRGVTKLPAPGTAVEVVARMAGEAGEELVLAAWRSQDGWECLGWAENDEGHSALCTNENTKIDPRSVIFAGGGYQVDLTGKPMAQRLIGLVPQDATSVVATSSRGKSRSVAVAGVAAGRGLHVFGTVLPADAQSVSVEARDSRDGVVASKSRSAMSR